MKYLAKKGKVKVKFFEITGGVDNINEFFLHPPRSNQYRMLSYAIYPTINKAALDQDSTKQYGSILTTYGSTGKKYDMTYTTKPIRNFINRLLKI